jgi:nucleoside-diphosphate-sugar epimerase
VVGENPPGNLKAMIYGIKKGYYFNISGSAARKSMVLASDVAKFILKAAEVGGLYNLTDGYHPNFNELSHCIAKQINRNYLPNMPIFFAKILAFIGDAVGQKFPINTNNLNKISSTLTFDDSKAREAFGWNPTPVLKGFKIHE